MQIPGLKETVGELKDDLNIYVLSMIQVLLRVYHLISALYQANLANCLREYLESKFSRHD